MSAAAPFDGVFAGRGDGLTATTGQKFSYRYSIPGDPRGEGAAFEYANHSEGGTFVLSSLSWVSFTCSRHGSPEPDTVTFSGFGTWNRDPRP